VRGCAQTFRGMVYFCPRGFTGEKNLVRCWYLLATILRLKIRDIVPGEVPLDIQPGLGTVASEYH
jgi:hypothetical protein